MILGNFGHSVASQCSTTTQYSSVTIQSLAATEPLSVCPDSGKVCILYSVLGSRSTWKVIYLDNYSSGYNICKK